MIGGKEGGGVVAGVVRGLDKEATLSVTQRKELKEQPDGRIGAYDTGSPCALAASLASLATGGA